MAINLRQPLLLLALIAFQCSSLHARSTPGRDYELDEFSMPQSDYQNGLDFSHAPVFFDTDRWNTQSYMPGFATETDVWDDQLYSTNDANGWDPVQEDVPLSTDRWQSDMFTSADQSELPAYDTFADSAMSTEDEIRSFTDVTASVELNRHRDDADFEEVYFDTSDADTIYKAPDDE